MVRQYISHHQVSQQQYPRRKGGRLGPILLMGVLLALPAFACLWMQMEILKYHYAMAELQEELEVIQEENRRLHLARAQLAAIERVEQLARRRLHLVYPTTGMVTVVEVEPEPAQMLQARLDPAPEREGRE